jgi:glutathione S-transferase
MLDAHLEGRDWLVGRGVTIADFEVGAMLTYAGPARHPLEPYAHVRAWYGRLANRPSWQATDPSRTGM